jgi:glycosyltransferase involved in cell wall biosynthesis
MEIILIDDGSTDGSGIICDEFKNKDERIKVVHKKNEGLSAARNEGIKIATGDYVLFLDSDDYWEDENFIFELNEKLEEKKFDIVIIGLNKFYEESNKFTINKHTNASSIEELIKENIYKACACDKVIKRQIIIENKLLFPIGKFSEDIEWCARLLKSASLNKIYYFQKNVYVYRQRKNSITKKVSNKNVKDMYEMIKNEKMDNNQNSNIINAFLAYEYSVLLGWTSLKCSDKELKKNIYQLSELLNYTLSRKVKIVHYIYKIFGIKITSWILGIFIKVKNK